MYLFIYFLTFCRFDKNLLTRCGKSQTDLKVQYCTSSSLHSHIIHTFHLLTHVWNTVLSSRLLPLPDYFGTLSLSSRYPLTSTTNLFDCLDQVFQGAPPLSYKANGNTNPLIQVWCFPRFITAEPLRLHPLHQLGQKIGLGLGLTLTQSDDKYHEDVFIKQDPEVRSSCKQKVNHPCDLTVSRVTVFVHYFPLVRKCEQGLANTQHLYK